jgi:hypothetical protein
MITFEYFIGQFAAYWAIIAIVFLFGRFVKKTFTLPRSRSAYKIYE